MSYKYDDYLTRHKNAVNSAWFSITRIPHDELELIFPNLRPSILDETIRAHDTSKYGPEEYDAYDGYFYKDKNEYKETFDKAWLHHIHCNPHHWQHWVLIQDDGDVAIEMPDNDIVEMVCDWWSFGWVKRLYENAELEALYDIFDWYEKHELTMTLGKQTKEKVEKLLGLIKKYLDEELKAYTVDRDEELKTYAVTDRRSLKK